MPDDGSSTDPSGRNRPADEALSSLSETRSRLREALQALEHTREGAGQGREAAGRSARPWAA